MQRCWIFDHFNGIVIMLIDLTLIIQILIWNSILWIASSLPINHLRAFHSNRSHTHRFRPNSTIAFITAIFGTYETSIKRSHCQLFQSDFIAFTDNVNIKVSNMEGCPWFISHHPFHLTHPSPIDNGQYRNSLLNNNHSFNIAKYYKQQFQYIPILKSYEIIIWLDGSIEIERNIVAQIIRTKIILQNQPIIGWVRDWKPHYGDLRTEAYSAGAAYTASFAKELYVKYPVQNVIEQYEDYVRSGYRNEYWKNDTIRKSVNFTDSQFGVWITCFIAYDNRSPLVSKFLDFWYLQTLNYTTQDQVGFSYAAQMLGITPYTLPDAEVWGKPHTQTYFYWKWRHGN